jgi:hypothetical protein
MTIENKNNREEEHQERKQPLTLWQCKRMQEIKKSKKRERLVEHKKLSEKQ